MCTDAEKDHLNALHKGKEDAPIITLEYRPYMN